MFRKVFTIGGPVVLAVAMILMTAAPGQAASPRDYPYGGYYGYGNGIYYGGYRHHYHHHRPYYGGYRYYPPYNSGFRHYYPYYGYPYFYRSY